MFHSCKLNFPICRLVPHLACARESKKVSRESRSYRRERITVLAFHCLLCRITSSAMILKVVVMLEATDPEGFLRICEAACNGPQLFGFADPLEVEGRLLHSAVICCTIISATMWWPCQHEVCQKAGNRDTKLRACL